MAPLINLALFAGILLVLGLISWLGHVIEADEDRADVARRLAGQTEDRQGRRWMRRT